ncbi:hypothetical protein PTB13_22210, partial [Bacillus sp. MHSD17]|nr:hypothetical protein [Bacillus sp. MHSD17]
MALRLGLVVDNEIVFSAVNRYSKNMLDYINGKGESIIETVHPDEIIFSRLKEFNNKIINNIPNEAGAYAFHTEIFHTIDDELVLCETASRAGGARIVELVRQSYGINLEEAVVKIQTGIWNKDNLVIADKPNIFTATYLLSKKAGKIKSIPQSIPFDWVTEYQPRAKVGDEIPELSVGSDLASFIISGKTKTDLWINIRKLAMYIQKEVT